MIAAVLMLASLQQPAAPAGPTARAAPDTAAGRPCQVAIDTVGHYGRQIEVRPGETNLFAGGGVRAHCQGTSSTLSADSVAWFAGVGRLDMLGGVQIRDTAITLDATTASYFLRQERLGAPRDVVAVSHATGPVLRGPQLSHSPPARSVGDNRE